MRQYIYSSEQPVPKTVIYTDLHVVYAFVSAKEVFVYNGFTCFSVNFVTGFLFLLGHLRS